MSQAEQQFLQDLDNKLWKAADTTEQLKAQFAKSDRREAEIRKNLAGLGYGW